MNQSKKFGIKAPAVGFDTLGWIKRRLGY